VEGLLAVFVGDVLDLIESRDGVADVGGVFEGFFALVGEGVVGVVDLEMTWSLDPWVRRIAAGTDVLRVEFGIYTEHLDRAVDLGLRSGDVIDGTDGLLTVGPYKVISDGSLNTRTAYCFDEYPGFEGRDASHGLPTVSKDQLLSRMRKATQAGIRPAVHAIGDHANGLALDAFEELGCTGSIEHAQLLTAPDIARFAKLGVVASVQPEHAMDDRDLADHYWDGRTERAFMLASLLNAGAELSLGSDAPVAPLDPWVTMAAAVGRTRDGREPWHAEQAISRAVGPCRVCARTTRGRSRGRGRPGNLWDRSLRCICCRTETDARARDAARRPLHAQRTLNRLGPGVSPSDAVGDLLWRAPRSVRPG